MTGLTRKLVIDGRNEEVIDYGYIPDYQLPEEEQQEVADFLGSAIPWDDEGRPAICTWSSIKPHLQTLADAYNAIRENHTLFWWHYMDHLKVQKFNANQGNLGSCAGFSAAHGHMVRCINQMITDGIDFNYNTINPGVMWCISKGFSKSGGQSMTKVMEYGNSYGHLPESFDGQEMAGKYVAGFSPNRNWTQSPFSTVADQHQYGCARLPQDATELAEATMLCCAAMHPVCIGNGTAVSGAKADSNGIKVAILSGGWAHATLFCGYREYKGKRYVFWLNSHGDTRYGQPNELEPGSGMWMDFETLKSFCRNNYGDTFVITYSECPYKKGERGLTLNHKLLPHPANFKH